MTKKSKIQKFLTKTRKDHILIVLAILVIMIAFFYNPFTSSNADLDTILPSAGVGAAGEDGMGAEGNVVRTHAPHVTAAAKAAFDPEGGAILQAYFDAALGDARSIRLLTRQLLDALGSDERWSQPEQASAAGLRLRQAISNTLTRAYYVPVYAAADARLLVEDFGWAMNPVDDALEKKGFSSVKVRSRILRGDLDAVSHPKSKGILAHAIAGIEQFVAKVPNGDYRILLVSRGAKDGRTIAWPFGHYITANGQARQLVETDITDAGGWIALSPDGVVTHAPIEVASILADKARGRPEDAPKDPAEESQRALRASTVNLEVQPAKPNTTLGDHKMLLRNVPPTQTGLGLVVPLSVRNGRITLKFKSDVSMEEPVIISAVVAQPINTTAILSETGRMITYALGTAVPQGPTEGAERGMTAEAVQSADEAARILPVSDRRGAKGSVWVPNTVVTLRRAIAGTIAGDRNGLGDLQSFIDDSGGERKRVLARANAVSNGLALKGIKAGSSERYRVKDALRYEEASGYIMRGEINRDFRIRRRGYAWDFMGDDSKPVYGDFKRITAKSQELELSKTLKTVDIAPWRSNLTTEGLHGSTHFRAKVKNGTYRVYLYTPKLYQPNGSPLAFGGKVTVNDLEIRKVDLRNNRPETWLRHGARVPSVRGGLEGRVTDSGDVALDDDSNPILIKRSHYLGARSHCGLVMALRVTVKDGYLDIQIESGAGGHPTLAGIVALREGRIGYGRRTRADSLLDIEPAAGGDPADTSDGTENLEEIEPAAGGDFAPFTAAQPSLGGGSSPSGGFTGSPGSPGGGFTGAPTSGGPGINIPPAALVTPTETDDTSTTTTSTTGTPSSTTTTTTTTTTGDTSTTTTTTTTTSSGDTTTTSSGDTTTTSSGDTSTTTTTGATSTTTTTSSSGDTSTTSTTTTGNTTTSTTTTTSSSGDTTTTSSGDTSTSTSGTTTSTSTSGTTTSTSTSGTTTTTSTSGSTSSGDPGNTITIVSDAGGEYEICIDDTIQLDGSASVVTGVDPEQVTIEWLLQLDNGETVVFATGTAADGLNPVFDPNNPLFGGSLVVDNRYALFLHMYYDGNTYIGESAIVCHDCGATSVDEPGSIMFIGGGMIGYAILSERRRRRRAAKAELVA